MPDVQEVFRLATNKVKPDPDALERQVRRQRAEVRKSRVRAYVAAAAVLILVLIGLWAVSRSMRNDVTPEGQNDQQSGSLSFVTTLSGVTPQKATVVDLHGNPTDIPLNIPPHPSMPVQGFAPSVSADGSIVAFVDEPRELTYDQIAVMTTGGTAAHFVATPGIVVDSVAISPDGSQIAFAGSVGSGLDDIYVVDAFGQNLRQLTTNPATDQYPAWSPDGQTIVFDNAGAHEQDDAQFSKTAEIFSVPADGGPVTQLTHNHGYDAAPSFSPDGSTIVDESFRGIAMMNANGTDYRRFGNVSGFTPRYSPNGKTIAFSYFSNRWRPDVQMGGNYSPSSALCLLATAAVKTGHVSNLANVGMATDYNTPQWIDSKHILVMRVPAQDPATH